MESAPQSTATSPWRGCPGAGSPLDPVHGAAEHPVEIEAGTLEDASKADLVVLAAGKAGDPGQSRLDQAEATSAVVREAVGGVLVEHLRGLFVRRARRGRGA